MTTRLSMGATVIMWQSLAVSFFVIANLQFVNVNCCRKCMRLHKYSWVMYFDWHATMRCEFQYSNELAILICHRSNFGLMTCLHLIPKARCYFRSYSELTMRCCEDLFRYNKFSSTMQLKWMSMHKCSCYIAEIHMGCEGRIFVLKCSRLGNAIVMCRCIQVVGRLTKCIWHVYGYDMYEV